MTDARISSQADLEQVWRTLMEPLGFSRTSLCAPARARGGLDHSDRLWAAGLYEAATVAGVPCEVVHAANDERLVPVPLDELGTLSA